MSRFVEHVFAVIGCVTVLAASVSGLLVALGIVKLKLEGTLEHHDDD